MIESKAETGKVTERVQQDGWTTGKGGSTQAKVKTERQGLNLIIGAGCRITGTLEISGESVIEGVVEGEIKSTGKLTISESASVDANIHGELVRVFGEVTGDIECTELLELHVGARVSGDITSPSLVIEDGVVFEGRCSMAPSRSVLIKSTGTRTVTKSVENSESK